MKIRLRHKDPKRETFHTLYIISFLFAAHLAIASYINSTFLSTFASERLVGILYTIGSLFAIPVLAFLPRILTRFGNYTVVFIASLIELFVLIILATSTSFAIIAPVFILRLIMTIVITLNMDVFVESNSCDGETGGIRGMFLTSANFAWVLSPLIAGLLLTNGDFWKIYTISSVLMVFVLFLLARNFRSFKDPKYDRVPFWRTLRQVWQNKDIYRIFMANLFLRFFYSWMVIYMPIYLYKHIGFEWTQIGLIFTIMLLPFVILEIPLGKLADTKLGEKELLTSGFILMAIATGTLAFITSTSVVVWALALLVTRIGASTVEIMSETYFFKQVDGNNTNIVSFFRNTRPIAYTIAPIVASGFLFIFDYRFLFLALGIIMLFGLRYSLTLKDTE